MGHKPSVIISVFRGATSVVNVGLGLYNKSFLVKVKGEHGSGNSVFTGGRKRNE